MRLYELFFVVRRSRRNSKDGLSRRKMRLMPVFILQTHNQKELKMFAQVPPDGECVLSVKTARMHYPSGPGCSKAG